MEVTSRLAAFAAGLNYKSILSECAICRASSCSTSVSRSALRISSSVTATVCPERYLSAVATPGPCTVLGYGVRTTATLAAFANRTLAEVLDFQDSDMDVITHNGTPIIPAALAIGEQLKAS